MTGSSTDNFAPDTTGQSPTSIKLSTPNSQSGMSAPSDPTALNKKGKDIAPKNDKSGPQTAPIRYIPQFTNIKGFWNQFKYYLKIAFVGIGLGAILVGITTGGQPLEFLFKILPPPVVWSVFALCFVAWAVLYGVDVCQLIRKHSEDISSKHINKFRAGGIKLSYKNNAESSPSHDYYKKWVEASEKGFTLKDFYSLELTYLILKAARKADKNAWVKAGNKGEKKLDDEKLNDILGKIFNAYKGLVGPEWTELENVLRETYANGTTGNIPTATTNNDFISSINPLVRSIIDIKHDVENKAKEDESTPLALSKNATKELNIALKTVGLSVPEKYTEISFARQQYEHILAHHFASVNRTKKYAKPLRKQKFIAQALGWLNGPVNGIGTFFGMTGFLYLLIPPATIIALSSPVKILIVFFGLASGTVAAWALTRRNIYATYYQEALKNKAAGKKQHKTEDSVKTSPQDILKAKIKFVFESMLAFLLIAGAIFGIAYLVLKPASLLLLASNTTLVSIVAGLFALTVLINFANMVGTKSKNHEKTWLMAMDNFDSIMIKISPALCIITCIGLAAFNLFTGMHLIDHILGLSGSTVSSPILIGLSWAIGAFCCISTVFAAYAFFNNFSKTPLTAFNLDQAHKSPISEGNSKQQTAPPIAKLIFNVILPIIPTAATTWMLYQSMLNSPFTKLLNLVFVPHTAAVINLVLSAFVAIPALYLLWKIFVSAFSSAYKVCVRIANKNTNHDLAVFDVSTTADAMPADAIRKSNPLRYEAIEGIIKAATSDSDAAAEVPPLTHSSEGSTSPDAPNDTSAATKGVPTTTPTEGASINSEPPPNTRKVDSVTTKRPNDMSYIGLLFRQLNTGNRGETAKSTLVTSTSDDPQAAY